MIEQLIESKCIKPSFIINHPILMSPLAKSHAMGRFDAGHSIPETVVSKSAAPYLSERFELFINKMEFINAYSEQNNEALQREGFKL
jgi:lysyl-tRNA synthetase, class II